jgi:DNA-binding response OmpR family regulator
MEERRIAIVEDEPSHALLLSYNLQQKGYITEQYQAEGNFIPSIRSKSIHLIIISVQLDDSDGLHLCEKIRLLGINIPILFLTTSMSQESCSCISPIDILNKPFSLADLFERVNRLLKP